MKNKALLFASDLSQGILAGICVAIGGCVFLACENRYVGAALFSVALLTICYFGFSLYTGRIGMMAESHKKRDYQVLLNGLFGNLAACALFGLLVIEALPALSEKSVAVCEAKLLQTPFQTFARGILCGILMFVAVWIFKKKSTAVGILFCIPVFILSGFEHSIADAFYLSAAGMFNLKAALYVLNVVMGNTVGGLLFPLLMKIKEKAE